MPRSSAQQSLATRARLVNTARTLFAARGYAAVGTPEIAAAAGVTRGALYHHFADKRDLFRAVFAAVEQDFVARVGAVAYAHEEPYARLVAAVEATLSAAADDPEIRIALVDAPAVLGFAEWRTIVADTSLAEVRALLEHAMHAGALTRHPLDALTRLVLGALNEATRLVADGADRAETQAALLALVEGLRAPD